MTDGPTPDGTATRTTSTQYVAYKPDWMDRTFLLLLVLDLMLTAMFVVYGSLPAREAQRRAQENTYLMCAAQQDDFDTMPEPWERNVRQLCADIKAEGP